MSSKRKDNHNATAEVECLENKTNNETDKKCFSAYLLNFFLFSSSSPISFNNVAMLALDCSLLRFKPFPLIIYDRSDLLSAKCMHSNASSMPFVNSSMSFERWSSCLSVSLFSFLRFSMELIFQMWTFKNSYPWICYLNGVRVLARSPGLPFNSIFPVVGLVWISQLCLNNIFWNQRNVYQERAAITYLG